jgi:hypothetical protein
VIEHHAHLGQEDADRVLARRTAPDSFQRRESALVCPLARITF